MRDVRASNVRVLNRRGVSRAHVHTVWQGGTVHELTTTVVSYLRRLLDYGDTVRVLAHGGTTPQTEFHPTRDPIQNDTDPKPASTGASSHVNPLWLNSRRGAPQLSSVNRPPRWGKTPVEGRLCAWTIYQTFHVCRGLRYDRFVVAENLCSNGTC